MQTAADVISKNLGQTLLNSTAYENQEWMTSDKGAYMNKSEKNCMYHN